MQISWRMALNPAILKPIGGAVALLGASLILAVAWIFVRTAEPRPAAEVEMLTSAPGTVQVFLDRGRGHNEEDSAVAYLPEANKWFRLRFEFKPGNLRSIRIDPTNSDNETSIRSVSVISATGVTLAHFPAAELRALNQIRSLNSQDAAVVVAPVAGANDPSVGIVFPEISVTGESTIRPGRLAKITALIALSMLAIAFLLRRFGSQVQGFGSHRRARIAIVLAAAVAAIVSTAPVVFAGKSFVSPNNGALLVYDSLPTLPGYSEARAENAQGADVGAIAWAHFVYSVIQERSLKSGELPLWNRYNGGGRTLLGQGQSMLGDPLNLIIMIVGTNAAPYDAKFVILRFIFAASIGLSIYALGGTLASSMIVGAASAFLSYFLYRLNHPAIFSLCYSPLVFLTWIGFSRSGGRALPWWCIAIVASNWLLLSSGTAKEAFVLLLTLNAAGLLCVLLAPDAGEQKRQKALLGLITLVCAMGLTAPFWGTFLDTLLAGSTSYQKPQADQFALGDLFAFSENYFYLVRDGRYWPALNFLLFFGLLASLATLVDTSAMSLLDSRSARVLAAVFFACVSIAFGVVPAWVLVEIPLIKSIHHVNNTFSTAAIVPACILAGLGLSQLSRTDKAGLAGTFWMIAVTVAVLLGLFMRPPEVSKSFVLGYLVISVVAFSYLVYVLRTNRWRTLSPAALAFLFVSLLVLLGRGAMWGDMGSRFDWYLLNPKDRVDLLAESAVTSIARSAIEEPTRVVSTGNTVFSGYRAALGLESIDGPDALEPSKYRELAEALKLPYGGIWRMEFTGRTLDEYRRALDFLGVGLVFSHEALNLSNLEELASEPRLRAYSRSGAWPRAFFADSVVPVSDAADVARLVALVEGPFVAVARSEISKHPSLEQLISTRSAGARIVPATSYRLTANTTAFTVNASGPGVIYLAENYEPDDFIVEIDGREVPYFSANHAFKGIFVPEAGSYRVEVRYWPKRLTLYICISLLSLAALIALVLFLRRRRATPPDPTGVRA